MKYILKISLSSAIVVFVSMLESKIFKIFYDIIFPAQKISNIIVDIPLKQNNSFEAGMVFVVPSIFIIINGYLALKFIIKKVDVFTALHLILGVGIFSFIFVAFIL